MFLLFQLFLPSIDLINRIHLIVKIALLITGILSSHSRPAKQNKRGYYNA